MIIDHISREMGIKRDRIEEVARRASHMYRLYQIPKRTGDGTRTIAHPAKPLKALQRWIAIRLLAQLPVHPAVFSYRTGIGIAQHAQMHRRHHFLLRIDLREFFPSITRDAVRDLLRRSGPTLTPAIDADDVELLLRLICRFNSVTIGAPTSPAVSNAILFRFDQDISDYCDSPIRDLTYTRYADDLYFSTNTPNVLEQVLPVVRERLLGLRDLQLRVNESKTTFTSPKRRRVVTGLVITPQSKLSVGRTYKRIVRSLLFKYTRGELSPEEISRLKGLLAFATGIEPDLPQRLTEKFGQHAIESLQDEPNVIRKIVAAHKRPEPRSR